jgi:hypothetical protein
LDGVFYLSMTFTKFEDIYLYMGRPKKIEEDKKIKIGISVDRSLVYKLKEDNINPSKFFDKKLKEHYGKKDL